MKDARRIKWQLTWCSITFIYTLVIATTVHVTLQKDVWTGLIEAICPTFCTTLIISLKIRVICDINPKRILLDTVSA